MKSKEPTVSIKQVEEAPVEIAVLAHAIVNLDKAATKLLTSGLNEKAIVTLLYELMPLSNRYGKSGRICNKVGITAVLRGLTKLRKTYCTAQYGVKE